jgi:PIN domain nuclease of toxin-antitoxin system
MIAHPATVLPKPLHGDPADQILVATAREENATILTEDQGTLTYEYV